MVPVPSAAPFGGVDDALPDAVEDAHVRLAGVVVDLGEIGHDVRRAAAAGDDVVDARLLRHVLAHHVDHVVHRFDRVERRAAAVGRRGGVRRDAAKAELAGDVGGRARRARLVAIARMPRHDGVHVLEQARREPCRPCPSRLLQPACRSSGSCPAWRVASQPVLHRDGGGQRAGAEQVVAAAVAGAVLDERLARAGLRLLRQAGQRVELADDADDRLAGSPRRDKCGRRCPRRRADTSNPAAFSCRCRSALLCSSW